MERAERLERAGTLRERFFALSPGLRGEDFRFGSLSSFGGGGRLAFCVGFGDLEACRGPSRGRGSAFAVGMEYASRVDESGGDGGGAWRRSRLLIWL